MKILFFLYTFWALHTSNKTSDTPVIFVLFGATGDLAVKKIFPALAALSAEGRLGPAHQIVAVSRREWTDADFHAFLAEKEASGGAKLSADFLSCVSYARADVEEGTGFEGLATTVGKLRQAMPEAQVLYYMSLAPAHQTAAIKALRDAKLLTKASKSANDAKLLIEKPFGTDLKSAKALDKLLGSFLSDDQVLRVDHYLGKDTLRAIMDLRENTPGFLEVISADTVASIRARIFEGKGIDGRGASYDGVGAFRDVGQNHLLEMLAVLVAELPKKAARAGFTGSAKFNWAKARAKALEHLAPPAKTCDLSRRGQYEGYHHEKGVPAGSQIETAFEVITSMSSGSLKGVPIMLEAGKKMSRAEALIEVAFKEVSGLPVRMTFRIQPNQDILIENRDGSVDAFDIPKTRDAYGNVILAAIAGDARGFVGGEEIEALWSYADRVVACWSKVPLEIYSPAKPFLIK